ncbi:MAG: hypothetical protein OXC46_03075 [Thaumarchaeota archaeon]|nr:hypothetical protein [Nitrososphaerota archaeon]
MASDKQKKYIKYLLGTNGYDTKFMHAKYSNLGVSMKDRSGQVDNWLAKLDQVEANNIIKQLLAEGKD